MALLGSTTLTGCSSIPDFIATGTLMTFQQTTAPPSWTKQTTHNNKALRVVSGAASSGGTTAFTSVFSSRTPAGGVSVSGSNSGGSVGNTTLTESQIASHTHNLILTFDQSDGGGFPKPLPNGNRYPTQSVNWVQNAGGSGSHNHSLTVPSWSGSASFTGSAMDFAVQYVDIIIAAKN